METITVESSSKSGTVHDFGAVYMQSALRLENDTRRKQLVTAANEFSRSSNSSTDSLFS